MEELMNQLITTAIGLSLLGGSWFVLFLTGVSKYLFNKEKWSWEKFFESVAKAALMGLATLTWVALTYGIDWFAGKCGADISALMEGASIAGVLGAVIGGCVYFLGRAFKNITKFLNTNHVEVETKEIEAGEIAEKFKGIFFTEDKVAEAHKEVEKEHDEKGGLGLYYSVPIDSYDSFRNATMGGGYDIDGYYSYQCWDFAALLWQQLGRWLSTGGGGGAKHCWTLARDENAGSDFELIYSVNDVQRGDIVVFGWGEWGHIGYADRDYDGGAYISLFGQNQSDDMRACVINCAASGFIGAFRFKRWKKVNPAPAPEPKPTKTKIKVGDTVVPTKLVDYNGTPLYQWDDKYTVVELSGDRAVLTARGQVWAAMNVGNIKKC